MTLARACRDREHVVGGLRRPRTATSRERRLEPYQLVTTGRRWYLLAFDRDRQDWRSLRLDRMRDVRARGSTFVATGGARRGGLRAAVDQRVAVPARRARPLFRPRTRCGAALLAVVGRRSKPDGPDACIVTAGADDPERMVLYFATVGGDFEVLEPPEVADAVAVGRRAAAARSDQAVTAALGSVPAQPQAQQQQPAMRLETHRQRVPPGRARRRSWSHSS